MSELRGAEAAFVEFQELAGVPMLLWCPQCHTRHIDEGEFEFRPHHTHACQSCGMVWRPAIVFTRGVEFLPGFKNNNPRIVPPPPSDSPRDHQLNSQGVCKTCNPGAGP